MPKEKFKIDIPREKLYFIYFIIFTIIILAVFAYLILGYYWHYFARVRQIDKYYSNQAKQAMQMTPQVSKYDPLKGQVDAPITIFEFNEFACQSCASTHSTLVALEKLYGNRLRFVFKGVPITLNPETRPSLSAAYCAWEQNQFWGYMEMLYANSNKLNQDKYLELAGLMNLNMDNFKQCLTTNKYAAVLDKNLTEAVTLGVTSVPTIFINDQKVEGFINYYTIKDIIDTKLKEF